MFLATVALLWFLLAGGALLLFAAVGRAGHIEDETRGYLSAPLEWRAAEVGASAQRAA